MYNYRARIMKIVDGDTIDVDIDLGFGITRRERVRVFGIDAPELHLKSESQEAIKAKSAVIDWASRYTDVMVRTVKDKDKYGRFLAEVWHPEGGSLADVLLHAGLASPYKG